MRQAQFIITPEIEKIVGRELGNDGAKKFLGKLQTGFKHLGLLYDSRNRDIPFDVLKTQLLNVRDAAKSLEDALVNSNYQVENLIRQGQFLRGDVPSAYNIHTDLVCYLENVRLGIDEIKNDLNNLPNRPLAWQEREVIGLLIECWVEARGEIPGKTPQGPFHRLVNNLLKHIGLTKRGWELLLDEINKYSRKGGI